MAETCQSTTCNKTVSNRLQKRTQLATNFGPLLPSFPSVPFPPMWSKQRIPERRFPIGLPLSPSKRVQSNQAIWSAAIPPWRDRLPTGRSRYGGTSRKARSSPRTPKLKNSQLVAYQRTWCAPSANLFQPLRWGVSPAPQIGCWMFDVGCWMFRALSKADFEAIQSSRTKSSQRNSPKGWTPSQTNSLEFSPKTAIFHPGDFAKRSLQIVYNYLWTHYQLSY